MDAQAIVGLVFGVGTGIAALIYYLTGSIKGALDKAISDIMEKLDEFVNALAQVREKIAERTIAINYIEKEIEQIKMNCRQCQKNHDNKL
jgi:archaellum component FlaC